MCPAESVNTFDRALSDDHILARNMVVETTHPGGKRFKMPGNPVKLSDTPCEEFTSPPEVGQHTREVYKSLLDLDDGELDDLAAQGVI